MKLLTLSSFLCIFLALFPSTSSNIVRLPLKKPTKEKAPHLWNKIVNFVSRNGSISIQNIQNAQYYATIKVGSNAQEFSLILDTGSNNLWIPDSYTYSSVLDHTFSCEESKTCKSSSQLIDLSYGSGDIMGYPVTDQIDLGGLVIPQFEMVVAVSIQGIPMSTFDGLLGLGFGENKRVPTVVEALKSNNLITAGCFSMYLGDDSNSYGGSTGEIIFGGYDPQYAASDFQFLKVKSGRTQPYWETDLLAVGLGNSSNISSTKSYPAIFDSGTSLMLLPNSHIRAIIQKVESQGSTCYLNQQGLYACDCDGVNKLEDLIFYFNEASFNVPVSSYTLSSLFGPCVIAIQSLEGTIGYNNPIVLGDVFLKNYYAMYTVDNSTVGLAKAVPTTHFPVWIIPLIIIAIIIVSILGYNCYKKRKLTRTFKGRGIAIGRSDMVRSLNDEEDQDEGVVVGGYNTGRY